MHFYVAKLLTASIEAINVPAIIIDGKGTLRSANRAFAAMSESVARDHRSRFSEQVAEEVVRRMSTAPETRTWSASFGPPIDSRFILTAVVLPPADCAVEEGGWLSEPFYLATLSGLPRDVADALAARYGLSAAEARVVEKRLGGLTTAEVATLLGTSTHTVRNQLQSVYEKMSVHGFSDLVMMIAAHDSIGPASRPTQPSTPDGRPFEDWDLDEAVHRVGRAEVAVERQRELVRELCDRGLPTRNAESLLHTFEELLEMHRRSLAALRVKTRR